MHQDTVLIYIGLAGIGAVLFFMLGYFIRKRYLNVRRAYRNRYV